jgi:hypothetical protein
MHFGDPVGGENLLLSKKQLRSYQSGGRVTVVLSTVMAAGVMMRTITSSLTPVCVVDARLGRRRGSATTVASVNTARSSATT